MSLLKSEDITGIKADLKNQFPSELSLDAIKGAAERAETNAMRETLASGVSGIGDVQNATHDAAVATLGDSSVSSAKYGEKISDRDFSSLESVSDAIINEAERNRLDPTRSVQENTANKVADALSANNNEFYPAVSSEVTDSTRIAA